MKRTLYALLAVFLCASANAQQVINGSMEPGASITTCSDIIKTTYNANMGNVWDAGERQKIYLADNNCGIGAPAQGNYFTVMKYKVFELGSLLVFKLSADLTVNQQYKIALQYRTPTPSNLGSLRYGYSKDSASFDSSAGIMPGVQSTTWKKDTVTFTPKKAWKFIWFEIITLQGLDYDIHIDDVKLLKVTSNGVEELIAEDAMNIYPNPAHGTVQIDVNEQVQLPAKLQVFDVAGKLMSEQVLNEKHASMNMSESLPGAYFMRITGKDHAVYNAKFFVQ